MVLSFGTGGVRAIMGPGPDKLNSSTMQLLCQGLANYIQKHKTKPNPKVAIAYDTRKNSALFAKLCARVLAANGIEALLFSKPRPTPLLSFACIYHHCQAGIVISASHNPPEYNGFKVYWDDGAQVVFPHDVGIMQEMEINSDVKIVDLKHPLIKKIPPSFDEIYLNILRTLQNYPDQNKKEGKNLKIIYSSLHGVGITLVPAALKELGFSSVHLVKKQCEMNGSFPHAKIPNPEEQEALLLGAGELLKKKADILLVNDPDADRIGVVVRHKDKAISFSGNQIAAICLYHLLKAGRHVQDNTVFVKTIVTTELFKEIAARFNHKCFDVLTGFKYIAAKIPHLEKNDQYRFLFGAEESCGYLQSTFVRDKDGVQAACLISEIALSLKKEKKTLYDQLLFLYKEFGLFREKLATLSLPKDKIHRMMQLFRQNPPHALLGKKVMKIEDFADGLDDFPSSDVLRFWLEDQTKVVIRPSGTEPKIKIYVGSVKMNFSSLSKAIKEMDNYLDKLIESICNV